MDITFRTEEGIFNYRACAVTLRDGKILAMKDERSPYCYLPGGRVALGETAEEALLREVREELGVEARIVRPLWLNQAFFTEEVSGERYHELCLYFLTDFSGTALDDKGNTFTLAEGRHTHQFEWLDLDSLRDTHFYPNFLKEAIFSLPESLTIRCEYE